MIADTPENRRRLLAMARLVHMITDPDRQDQPGDHFDDRNEVQELIWDLERLVLNDRRVAEEGKRR
jgi:hypothetical protein